MRCFVAVDIDNSVRSAVASCISEISEFRIDGLKFVEPDNLHVTVKFIGEVSDAKIPDIVALLGKISCERFKIAITGIGGFPKHSRNPRVIWAGIETDENLPRLFDAVDRRLFDAGIPRDTKPFHPHLTLARAKKDLSDGVWEYMNRSARKDFGSFVAEGFSLYRSDLTGKGPIYSRIQDFPLG